MPFNKMSRGKVSNCCLDGSVTKANFCIRPQIDFQQVSKINESSNNMAQVNEYTLGLGAMILWSSILVLFLKLITEIKARREGLKVYEKGNVPSVPVNNVFAGHMGDIIYAPNNIEILDKYHKKLGKTIGLFYGPHPWAFTCDAELLHRIFVIESNKFVNLNDYRIPFSAEWSSCIAQMRDDDWRNLRKALNPCFSTKQMKSNNVDNDIEYMSDKLAHCIQDHQMERIMVGEPGEQVTGRVVDILDIAKKFSIGVISKVAFGGNDCMVDMDNEEKNETIKKIHEGSKVMVTSQAVRASVIFGPQVQRLMGYLKRFSNMAEYSEFFKQLANSSIAARRKLSPNEVKRDRKFIDAIIESVARHKFGDDVLQANLFFFLVAGFETSANTMALTLWLLAKHPEKQEKLRDAILSGNTNDKYMEWCISETLRLYPGVPLGIGRELTEDYHYEGMTFYKGSSVVANFYRMHRLEEYWGSDADEFEPERFSRPLKHHAQYMAFGAGSRHCIGYNLAIMEVRAFLTRLLSKYRVVSYDKTPNEIEYTSPNLVHMIIENSINLAFVEIDTV